jgi:hypothetical protein
VAYISRKILNYDVVQFLAWKKVQQAKERILIKSLEKMTAKEKLAEL